MLSFTSSLSRDSEAFAIFVTEKSGYKDKKDVLSNSAVKKINSFLIGEYFQIEFDKFLYKHS